MPSTLKAYFDYIAQAGITLRYTENGSVGLLTGKSACVFAARGGVYNGSGMDTQSPYLRNFLVFLGIEDVRFVYAEGLAQDEARKRSAILQAREAIGRLNAIERRAA